MKAFEEVHDRRTSLSSKWRRYRGRDILPFWVADMDFRTAPPVIAALHEQVSHGIFGYADVPDELTDLVIAYLAQRYHWQVQAEWLVWLPGVAPGFNMAARATGDPGQAIVIPKPVYYPFLDVPRNANRQALYSNLQLDGSLWVMDFDTLEMQLRSTDPSPCLFMLCNPQNPTGRVYTQQELERLAALLLRHRVPICSDEIHCDLILDPDSRHIPIASLAKEIAAQSITLMAPTKTFNMPGIGCAFAVVPDPDLRRRFNRARLGLTSHPSPLALCAALAAYREGWDWHADLIRCLRVNADRLFAHVQERLAGVKTTRVQATCLAWLDIRSLGISDPLDHFERHGIGLSDGAQFGGPGFMRFNFGCPQTTLEAGLQRLTASVAACRAQWTSIKSQPGSTSPQAHARKNADVQVCGTGAGEIPSIKEPT